MQFEHAKLRDAVRYICSRFEPGDLGPVQLHKALYLADMVAYALTRKPITGATYLKRSFGVQCYQLPDLLDEMQDAGALDIRTVNYFGFLRDEYAVGDGGETPTLNDTERGILDDVIASVGNRGGVRIIGELDDRAPWERVEYGSEIPYRSSLSMFPSIVSGKDMKIAKEGLQEIEAARQNGDSMGFEDFGVFLARYRKKDSRLRP